MGMANDAHRTLPPTPARSSAGRRVLVADDEEAICRASARILKSAGFDVVTAHDGNSALDEIMKGGFDVILSDIRMPGATGIDLLRVVRAYDLDVPVVLVTGNPNVESAIEAVELGALQYLCKPILPADLVSAVERASRLHRLARLKRDAIKLQ